jgi:hypothetical protein
VRDIIYPIGGLRPPTSEEKCSLCKRTIPYSKLTRCSRCKRLYCKSCITEDFLEGKYMVCLDCARRFVSPKEKFKGKYTPLTMYLSRKAKWTRWVRLPFSRIEGILGKDLPASALQNSEWWKNTNSSHGKAWFSIGWEVKEVNLEERTVIFTRPEVLISDKHHKRKRVTSLVALPEYKPRKTKAPSLTRIAIAQARLQNISRRKASIRKYRGRFRPKSAYEKRLWKIDEKP